MRLLLICSFLLTTCFAKSQQQLLLAVDSLFKKQQFFEASIYAEQVLFESSTVAEKMQAIDKKIACLKKLKDYTAITAFIADCYTQTIPEDCRVRLIYEEILANYFSKQYRQTIHLSQFYPITNKKERQIIDVLKILSYNNLEDWKIADSLWQLFANEKQLKDSVIAIHYKHLPKLKNENTAAILSAYLPGTGQVYARKPLEGLASFIFQVGSIWAGVAWWDRGYKIASFAVGGSFWKSFNDGGKRRARKLVQDYNEEKVNEFNATLNKAILSTTQHLFVQ